jgi:hypothetical protein
MSDEKSEQVKTKDMIKIILDIPEETQTTEFKRLDGKKVVQKIVETIVAMAKRNTRYKLSNQEDINQ